MSPRLPKSKLPGRVAAALQAGVAVLVVEPARLGVREHLVGLGDLTEAGLGVGLLRDVRMELLRELAERLLDLRVARATLDAEQLVEVSFRRRHRCQGRWCGGLGCAQLSSYATSTSRESSSAAARTVRTAFA